MMSNVRRMALVLVLCMMMLFGCAASLSKEKSPYDYIPYTARDNPSQVMFQIPVPAGTPNFMDWEFNAKVLWVAEDKNSAVVMNTWDREITDKGVTAIERWGIFIVINARVNPAEYKPVVLAHLLKLPDREPFMVLWIIRGNKLELSDNDGVSQFMDEQIKKYSCKGA